MADTGAAWSLRPFVEDLDDISKAAPLQVTSKRQLWTGTDTAHALAVKHGVPTGWGSDILFDAAATEWQGERLAYFKRCYRTAQAMWCRRPRRTRSAWACPGRAIPSPARWASSRRGRMPT